MKQIEQTARNELIIKKFLDGYVREVDLAREHKVSRQRVHQILQRAGIDTTQIFRARREASMTQCQSCFAKIPKERQYCSKKCWSDYHRVPVKCANPNCGKVFVRVLSQIKKGKANCCCSDCRYAYTKRVLTGRKRDVRKNKRQAKKEEGS